MSTRTMFCSPDFSIYSCRGHRSYFQSQNVYVSPTMKINPTSSRTRSKELSVDIPTPSLSQSNTSRLSDFQFDRLQPLDQECNHGNKLDFGRFVTRAAVLDEEYWTAAWLRAESHWEDQPYGRYINSYKRKFAEQEYNALKRRCSGPHENKCTCFVAVKKAERNVELTILKSIVGTLDLSIGHLLHGEAYPGERVKAPIFCSINRMKPNRYGYIANLCVAKSARRQGIASNMLHLAVESAKSNGVEQVFVHVHKDNKPAWDLYQKIGFQIVEVATDHLSEEQNYLLCLKA